jgi:hypothetical protein
MEQASLLTPWTGRFLCNQLPLAPSDMPFYRVKYADLTATAASIVAAVHIPDPTAEGLFQQPMRPRQRGYRMLDVRHAYGTSYACF